MSADSKSRIISYNSLIIISMKSSVQVFDRKLFYIAIKLEVCINCIKALDFNI